MEVKSIKRDSSGQGSVIVYEYLGKEKRLFVADAKFRSHSEKFRRIYLMHEWETSWPDAWSNAWPDFWSGSFHIFCLTQSVIEAYDYCFTHDFPTPVLLERAEDFEGESKYIPGIGTLDQPTIMDILVIHACSKKLDQLDKSLPLYDKYSLEAMSLSCISLSKYAHNPAFSFGIHSDTSLIDFEDDEVIETVHSGRPGVFYCNYSIPVKKVHSGRTGIFYCNYSVPVKKLATNVKETSNAQNCKTSIWSRLRHFVRHVREGR